MSNSGPLNWQNCLKIELLLFSKPLHLLQFEFLIICLFYISLVVEYMSGGSVYDYLHKQRGSFKLPTVLKVAIDVSKGMNYLHQNNIIHRDLKAANLLMDENEVRFSFQLRLKTIYFVCCIIVKCFQLLWYMSDS